MSINSEVPSVSTLDSPFNESFRELIEEVKSKIDDVSCEVEDVNLLVSNQTDELTDVISKILREEGRKIRVELTKVIKAEITAALTPHRRLVPAEKPKVPQEAVDLTGDTEDESSSDSDSIKPTQKRTRWDTKLNRYTEH